MSAVNQGLPISGSANGLPIALVAAAQPGTLIHTSSSVSDDYIWLWAVNASDFNCVLEVYKGNAILGYSLDNTVILTPKSNKQLIEPGILTNGAIEVRGFVTLNSLSQRANVLVSGFAHRRLD